MINRKNRSKESNAADYGSPTTKSSSGKKKKTILLCYHHRRIPAMILFLTMTISTVAWLQIDFIQVFLKYSPVVTNQISTEVDTINNNKIPDVTNQISIEDDTTTTTTTITSTSNNNNNNNKIPDVTNQISTEADTTTTTSNNNNNNNKISDRTTRHAVIHMGPHKTGSTTIQDYSKELKKELKADGFIMPWMLIDEISKPNYFHTKKRLKQNQVNFSTCFHPKQSVERIRFPCDNNLLHKGSNIAKMNKNMFVSAESFTHMDHEGISKLQSYLSIWDQVTIILYYRRYYSFVLSSFYQQNKKKVLTERRSLLQAIDKYIQYDIATQTLVPNESYTTMLYQRIRPLTTMSNNTNIVIRNMHDDAKNGKLAESFYCHAMPGTNHTCHAIRSGVAPSIQIANVSPTFDYDDLALAAKQNGWIQFDDSNIKQTLFVTKSIQKFQERTLNQSRHDFPRTCPTKEQLDKLWTISLETEMSLFPNLFSNFTLGRLNLKKDFDVYAKSSLCVVDVGRVLEQKVWQTFFKTFKATE